MSPSASTAEVPVELAAARPKRKPRVKVDQAFVDAAVAQIDMIDAELVTSSPLDGVNNSGAFADPDVGSLTAPSALPLPPKKPRARRVKVATDGLQLDDAVTGTAPDIDISTVESTVDTTTVLDAVSTDVSTTADFADASDSIASSSATVLLTGEATPMAIASTMHVSGDLALLSAAIRAGRFANLPELGVDAQALLNQPVPSTESVQPDPYCALVLTLPSGPIEVSDGVRLLLVLTGIDLGHSAIELPHTQWLHSAVIGRLRQTPLRDVIAITRGCLSPEIDAQPLLLSVCSQQHRLSMQVRASALCWLDLLARGGWQRAQMPANTFDDLPLHLPLVIAAHTLSHQMVSGLVAGDVLLPDTAYFDCTGAGALRWRGRQINVQFTAPAAITIFDTEPTMLEQTETDSDDLMVQTAQMTRPDATLTPGAFDGVPVQLQFEMGRCRTTLGQLRTLVPGTVLPVEGGSPAAISILANGRQMGQGELVDINGQLGIRIIHWA